MPTGIKILFLLLCSVACNAQPFFPMQIGTGSNPYDPSITSWNPFDRNPNIGLSNNYLTVTSLAVAGFEMVRCNKVCSTGTRQYFEVTIGAAGFDIYIGFDDGTGSLTAQPGSGSNAVSYYASTGEIIVNGTAVQTGLATAGNGDIIDITIDLITNHIQFYKNNFTIGTFQTITGGDMFPMVGRGAGVNKTASTTNFGATTPTYTYAGYTIGPP